MTHFLKVNNGKTEQFIKYSHSIEVFMYINYSSFFYKPEAYKTISFHDFL